MRREKGIERNGQGSGAGNNRRNGRRGRKEGRGRSKRINANMRNSGGRVEMRETGGGR